MILNACQEEYTDDVSGAAGAQIVIHSKNIMPQPEEEGLLVRPGELTSIGVMKVYMSQTRSLPFYLHLNKLCLLQIN